MSDYTPSTDEVRQMANSYDGVPNDVFDRWIAAHDESVRAEERERIAQRLFREGDFRAADIAREGA